MKQRLIGTIVLLCLALIFIPLLLDGEGIAPPAMNLNIPPRPAFETQPIPEPQRPVITQDQTDASGTQPQLEVPPFVEEPPPGQDAEDSAEPTAAAEPPPQAAEPAPTVAPEPERVPALDTAGLPEGWVVRLGTFGDRANADRLLKQLLDAEYKAYVETVSSAQGALAGVYVGPVLTRAEADSLLRELNARFKIEGLVRRFSLDEAQ